MSLQPGLTDLAGAARGGLDAAELHRYIQHLASGVPVILAHPAAEQTSAALRTAASHLATTLGSLPGHDVIVDLGRMRPGSPSSSLANACEVLVVVLSCVAEDLVTLLTRVGALERIAPVELALVGRAPHPVDEVRRASGIETVHPIPFDAAAVRRDPAAAKGRRSDWSRAVAQLTRLLAAAFVEAPEANAGSDEVAA